MQSSNESILTANVKAVLANPSLLRKRPVAKIIYRCGGGAGTGGVGNSSAPSEGDDGAGEQKLSPLAS